MAAQKTHLIKHGSLLLNTVRHIEIVISRSKHRVWRQAFPAPDDGEGKNAAQIEVEGEADVIN